MTYATDFEPFLLEGNGSRSETSPMKVYEGLDALPTRFGRSSVTIGNFDGVHRGHQALIRRAVEDAHAHDRAAIVLTFDRHPSELFRPESAPQRLTTPAQRNALIAALGVDALIVARFDHALAELSHEEFLAEILKERLGAEAIVEGADFCFGKGRVGDLAYLQRVQGEYGFTLHALKPVLVNGVRASSTGVREHLRAGEIAEAEAILGHGFGLFGRVVSGQRLNRAPGYMAANLDLPYRQMMPAGGSYAVLARLGDGREWGGVCTIGAGPGHCIQTYLFACDEDLYGRDMTLRFVRRLSAGEKFDSLTDVHKIGSRQAQLV